MDDTIGHLMMAQIEDMKLLSPKKYIRTKNGVDFIPSSIYLSVVDAKLRLEMGAERMLSGILEPLRGRYDYILVDTCPSLGTLTINALAASDEVIITVNPQLLAMMGMQDFLRTVVKIRKRINPGLGIAGILTAAEAKNIDTYILFTGDSHFQPVTRYLTQKKKKEVIVYRVHGAFSSQLKATVTKHMEYPFPEEMTRRYYDMIIQNFDYISGKNINPTFLKTVEAVADHNQIPPDTARAALQEMLDKGYVYQKEVPIAFNRKIKIVCANWELLIKDGLWNPDT